MGKTREQYQNDADFLEFLSREFDKTTAHATIEELAEFAFGSLDAAVEAYQERMKYES